MTKGGEAGVAVVHSLSCDMSMGFYIDRQIIWDRGRDDAKQVGCGDDRNKMGYLRYSKIMKGSRKAWLIPRD